MGERNLDPAAPPAARKPIRPSSAGAAPASHPPSSRPPAAKKQIPPDTTNAENFYYLKQMQSKTLMVIVLKDGETLEGVIEWYDRASIKLNREGAPNLLLFKDNIKYMYKA
jgi:sRNA-binding regulator protein Hfq